MTTKEAAETTEGAKPNLDQVLVLAFNWFQARQVADRRDALWANVRRSCWIAFFVSLTLLQLWFLYRTIGPHPLPSTANIAVIPLDGPIDDKGNASADKVVPMIEAACKKDTVSEIVFRINSPGGSPNESERITSAIEACRAQTHKKFTMLIDGLGASAAYMVAIHGDRIVAGRYSLVGSVGAIMRYVDAHDLANRFGLNERVFRSGSVKGGPSMLSGSDPQMDAINQELVSTLGKDFLAEVESQRKGKLKITPEDLFTGRIWTGPNALQLGLIDKVATFEELKATDYKNADVVEMKPKSPLSESFGARAFVRDVILSVLSGMDEGKLE